MNWGGCAGREEGREGGSLLFTRAPFAMLISAPNPLSLAFRTPVTQATRSVHGEGLNCNILNLVNLLLVACAGKLSRLLMVRFQTITIKTFSFALTVFFLKSDSARLQEVQCSSSSTFYMINLHRQATSDTIFFDKIFPQIYKTLL